MMKTVLQLIGTIGLLISFPILLWATRGLRQTTLLTACGWAIGGLLVWMVAWVASVLTSIVEHGRADQLWYAAAVLLLCPFISVLGAKRPGSRVWNWFVLLPLVLVLSWPVVVMWKPTMQGQLLRLEAPALVGYALVLVMGTGNFWGTRFTASSFLVVLALALTVAPFSAVAAEQFSDPGQLRAWATVCLTLAIVVAAALARRTPTARTGCDRVWIDFRNGFGIVWASRIQDRVNETAQKQNLPAKLTPRGLVWTEESVDVDVKTQTEAHIEHTLRWLLRRFVQPEWIDRRMRPRH